MNDKNKLEIAVYGKGGIGKSTISANLSAALQLSGRRVLQIGCDPKHDSTRYLMHGERIPTVLELMRTGDSAGGAASAPGQAGDGQDFLCVSSLGVGCVEAGGPRPGVGCAGRGIISAFEYLKKNHAKDPYDIVVYDVLGDVVCGGFAVPVRREYADAVFVVTSGEYMALYAANNILRGIRNYDGETGARVAGIIYNERKVANEDERVRRFARAVGLPIAAKIPRSTAFAIAEEQNRTVMEMPAEGSAAAETELIQSLFRELAGSVNDGLSLYPACPLSDEALEQAVLGGGPTAVLSAPASLSMETGAPNHSAAPEHAPDDTRESLPSCPPLYGCAFNGAATAAVRLTDAVVIAHSPRACAFYTWQNISSPGRKNLFNRGVLMPSAISPNFISTEMGQDDVVFGGMDRLRQAVRNAQAERPGAVIVISSCVSGIIGDDIHGLEEMSTPETPVIVIAADGDIAGDYMEGQRMLMHTLASKFFRRGGKPQPGAKLVNIIGETGMSNNSEQNFRVMEGLLAKLGIRVGCRFLGDATIHEMQHFTDAPLNLLADDLPSGHELAGWLKEQYGITVLDQAFPVGFSDTESWLTEVANFFHCSELVEPLAEAERLRFQREIEALRPRLSGKKILFTVINIHMDWLFQAAKAAGIHIAWVGVLNYLHQDILVTDDPEIQSVTEESLSRDTVIQKIRETSPDLVVTDYTFAEEPDCLIDTLPMTPTVGFHSGVRILERWADLFEAPEEGGWKNDKRMFEKYYA